MLFLRRSPVLLLVLLAAAFALRVAPSYHVVFRPGGIRFQESDAWFHIRSAHNLLAHFPRRSTFDPYALYPSGQEVPTGPAWDYWIATTAWILGLGSPSAGLVDRVAAWLPAILGALFVLPVYDLARRIHGAAAAAFAALWAAVTSGAFLWITHLGLADHHAAEGLLAFLVLYLLCRAAEAKAKRRLAIAAGAGVVLGVYFLTRPAGVFIPGILCVAAVLNGSVAVATVPAALVAALVFAPSAHILWGDFALLSLAATAGVAAAMSGVNAAARRFGWRPAARTAVLLGGVAVCVCVVALAAPAVIGSLWFQVRRVAGFTASSSMVQTVQEMQPVYRAGSRPGWSSVIDILGTVWIPAAAGLVWLLMAAVRRRGAALVLVSVWCLTVAVAAIAQARMAIYFGPAAAMLAGIGCAEFVQRIERRRTIAVVLVVVIVLALNFRGIAETEANAGPTDDWAAAAQWLRANTPEPFGDPGLWSALTRAPGTKARWGVAAWWPNGYFIEEAGRRVPLSNGTQAGTEEYARLLLNTFPPDAVGRLRALGLRYVVVDPETPFFVGLNRSAFPLATLVLHRDLGDYVRIVARPTPGGVEPLPVYLPAYYRSMAARLYLKDGQAAPGGEVWVFQTEKRKAGARTIDVVIWGRLFPSETEAMAYVAANSGVPLTAGCIDPSHSCVPLDAVAGMRRVFSSDPDPISPARKVRAVKIFEVEDR